MKLFFVVFFLVIMLYVVKFFLDFTNHLKTYFFLSGRKILIFNPHILYSDKSRKKILKFKTSKRKIFPFSHEKYINVCIKCQLLVNIF